jgi:hypothetical protein
VEACFSEFYFLEATGGAYMARLRTTANRITERIKMNRHQSTRTVCKFGIPLALLASVIIPVCIPLWAIIWFAIYQSAKQGGSSIMLAGAAGEDRVLAALSALPADYTLFNQIRLPDKRSSTGFREADFVVVGYNGVFIIENKDYRGELRGEDNAANWELHKIGIGGTPYTKPCRNPVRQVRVYVTLLSRLFAMRGINVRIIPLVSLSQNNSLACISSPKVQVMGVDELCGKIIAHEGTLSAQNLERVIGLLEELRAGTFKEPAASDIASPVGDCQNIPESNSYTEVAA